MTRLSDLTRRLDAAADPATREWWERYLKGAIPFRGVKMAGIRRAVHDWHGEHRPGPDGLRTAALALLREPYAEDKLAGILIMQELLLPAGALDWPRDLPALAAVFDDGAIADWNTTDWLCVRVLGPLVERHGKPCARAVAAWVEAPGLWRRRSAGVAFVNLAARGDDLFPGFADLVLDVCAANARDPERFAQTGVGWVLRELSDAAPDRVYDFVRRHRPTLSREAVRMAAARLSDEQRDLLGLPARRSRR